MNGMTAAVNAEPRATSHPQGGAGSADPHTALRNAAALPTSASAALPDLAAAVISDAAQRLPRRSFSKGETLYRRGDGAAHAFIIEAGLVALTLGALSDRERVVALAGPGDVVGALAPNLREYQDSAAALSGEVTVRPLPLDDPDGGDTFQALLTYAAGEQIVRLTGALEDSAFPVPARVARALLRLGDRFGQRMEDGAVRLTLPITHETLAALVGAARETTTGIVQQLRQQGLLEGTRGSYRYRPGPLGDYAYEAALAAR